MVIEACPSISETTLTLTHQDWHADERTVIITTATETGAYGTLAARRIILEGVDADIFLEALPVYSPVLEEGEEDLFVHYTATEGSGFRSLGEGERVSYEPTRGRKGEEAKNVRKVE